MSGNDPKRDKKFYQNPDYTNEGLAKEVEERKRGTTPFDSGRRTGEYDLNPVVGESKKAEVEARLTATKKAEEEAAEKKRTLHDPKKFEELLKDRAGESTQSQQVQKITNPQIEALRTSSLKKDSPEVQAKQKMQAFFRNISQAIGGIFHPKEKKTTQCDLYGHIVPPGGWSGDFPNCTECGREIRSKDELRKSSAGQITHDMKPWDNRLDL